MLQPFLEFEKKYLPRLRQLRKIYLVSQTYKRGEDKFSAGKTVLLLTCYSDKGAADQHLKDLKNDPLAAIIHLDQQTHFNKLMEMLGDGSKYRLFWSVVKDVNELEKYIKSNYFKNLKRYLDHHLQWKVGGYETVETEYEVELGELMITLKWRTQKRRIKFEEIENA